MPTKTHLGSLLGLAVAALAACVSGTGSATAPQDAGTSGPDACAGLAACLDAGPAGDASPSADAGPDDTDAALSTWPDAGSSCVPPTGAPASLPTGGLPANGLALWLRADQGVYTVPATAGASDASATPPAVCAWADQSGNGWLLANATASQPTLAPTGVGGQPAVSFANGATNLQIASVLGLGATQPRTLVAVEALGTPGLRFQPITQGVLGSSGTYVMIDANTFQTAGSLEGVYLPTASFDSATATSVGSARVHVLTVASMTVGTTISTSATYRVNGAPQTLTLRAGTDSYTDFSTANFTAVGPSFGGGSPSGMVAEVLVYGRALTTSEATTVEGVLKARYGNP